MDNFIIFFDNITFRYNNAVYNYLKRFIIYEIIYRKYILNKYKDIILIKTYPTLNAIKLNRTDNITEDIYDILTSINNVIYKKYDDYEKIHFKNIIDKIQKIEEKTINNDIIIIFSINSNKNFTNINKEYIDGLFSNFKSNISVINISHYPLMKKISDKINEFFIDIKSIKIEDFFLKNIFNLNLNIKNINIIDKIEKDINYTLNVDSNIDLLEFIILLNYIEKTIIINSNIKNNSIDKNYIFFKKILNLKIISETNSILINIVKSFQNSIKDIFLRFYEFKIKLPINKLNESLNSSYIKNILEFYELIYTKILKYNFNFINLNFKKFNKLLNSDFSEINFNDFTRIESSTVIDNSLEYLKSTLSLTNWIEEYNNINPFGFMIKYELNNYSYKGMIDLTSSIIKTYPNMKINSITNNWVSLYDYYQIIISYIENSDNLTNNEYQNNDDNIFNMNDFLITDNILGDGNILLPVYINKNHWKLVKVLWKYHLTFINNSLEFEYNKKMDNIYYLTLLKSYNNIKNINQNIKSSIRLFCYILRTCIQISIDNKYMYGILKEYPKVFQNLLEYKSFENNYNFINWIIKFIQLIISNNCNEQQIEELKIIRNNIFDKFIIDNYDIKFWDILKNPNTDDNIKNEEINNLKNNVLQENISWLYLEYDLINLNNIIKKIYSIIGLNKFIKYIDSINGCLNDNDDIIGIKSFLDIINTQNEQFNIKNYNVDITKYIL